jgi:hypothetical protein
MDSGIIGAVRKEGQAKERLCLANERMVDTQEILAWSSIHVASGIASADSG